MKLAEERSKLILVSDVFQIWKQVLVAHYPTFASEKDEVSSIGKRLIATKASINWVVANVYRESKYIEC